MMKLTMVDTTTVVRCVRLHGVSRVIVPVSASESSWRTAAVNHRHVDVLHSIIPLCKSNWQHCLANLTCDSRRCHHM